MQLPLQDIGVTHARHRARSVGTRHARTRLLLAYGSLVDLAGLTQTDRGTVLGLLLEGAQRLQQEPTTRQRWQGVWDNLLATLAEERRVLQARKRGMVHVPGEERNGAPDGQALGEGKGL